MAWTTTALVKSFIGIPSTTTTDDTFISQVIPTVEALIEKFCDRVFEQTTYTDYYCGNNQKVLVLNEYPVLQTSDVSLVAIDPGGYWGIPAGAFASDTVLDNGSVSGTPDYSVVLDGNNGVPGTARLYKVNAVWPGVWQSRIGYLTASMKQAAGNIKVTYMAGYAASGGLTVVPQDLLLAEWQLIAQIRLARARGLMPASEGLSEYNYSLQQMIHNYLQIGSVNQILSRYRRLRERYPMPG